MDAVNPVDAGVATQRRQPARRAATVVVFVAVLGLNSCTSSNAGGGQSPTGQQTVAARPTLSLPPPCKDLFRPGQRIDYEKAKNGCTDPDGGIHFLGNFRCADGRHLWSVDANTGAPKGWGFDGDVFHTVTGDIAADPAYSRAYQTCNG